MPDRKVEMKAPLNWWEGGGAGTRAWQDEANFLKFLAGFYGTYVLALGYRAIYSFRLQNSPLYQWWEQNGKPSNGAQYRTVAPQKAKELYELSQEEWQTKLSDPNFNPQQAPEGYKWTWKSGFSETGQPTQSRWTLDSVTPEVEPVDPMLQRLMNLPIEQFEWQKQQAMQSQQQQAWQQLNQADVARWLAQGQAAQLENTRMMNRSQGRTGFQQEQKNQETLAKEFESMRSMFEPSPRNWIQASLPNPYKPREMTVDEQYDAAKTAKDAAKSVKEYYDAIEKTAFSDPNKSLTPSEKAGIANSREQYATAVAHEADISIARAGGREAGLRGTVDVAQYIQREQEEQIEESRWAAPRPAAGGEGFEVGRPSPYVETRTAIPPWLQKAAGVGQWVPPTGTRVPIQTPSAQSWSALSDTQQQMFGGLVDWSGQRTMADILGQTQSMIPQNPSLGRSWKASQQRV